LVPNAQQPNTSTPTIGHNFTKTDYIERLFPNHVSDADMAEILEA
jgi:hypothetical protein